MLLYHSFSYCFMICFILAGGFAKRMWPITKEYPKCLLPIGEKPLLIQILDKLPNMETYVSTNEVFSSIIEDHIDGFENVNLVTEDSHSNDEKLGSVGAIIEFIDEYNIEEDILILAADNYYEQSLDEFIDTYDGNPLVGIYDISEVERAKDFGVAEIGDNKILSFIEKPDIPKSTLIGTGSYIIPKNCFSKIKDINPEERDHLGVIIEKLLEDTVIRPFLFKGKWEDIGSIKSYYYLFLEEANGTSHFINSDYISSTIHSSLLIDCKKIQDSEIYNSIIYNSEIVNNKIENKIVVNNNILDKEDL